MSPMRSPPTFAVIRNDAELLQKSIWRRSRALIVLQGIYQAAKRPVSLPICYMLKLNRLEEQVIKPLPPDAGRL